MARLKPTPAAVARCFDDNDLDFLTNLEIAANVPALTAGTVIPITLPDILLTSLDTPADLVTDYIPGVVGNIVRWGLITQVAATSGGTADADIHLEIETTEVTGSEFQALTQTDFSAIGKVKQSGAISAANALTAASKLSIVCDESAVNFTAGLVTPIIWVELTTETTKINAIIAALVAAGLMTAP
jgi:hypothetical protein